MKPTNKKLPEGKIMFGSWWADNKSYTIFIHIFLHVDISDHFPTSLPTLRLVLRIKSGSSSESATNQSFYRLGAGLVMAAGDRRKPLLEQLEGPASPCSWSCSLPAAKLNRFLTHGFLLWSPRAIGYTWRHFNLLDLSSLPHYSCAVVKYFP